MSVLLNKVTKNIQKNNSPAVFSLQIVFYLEKIHRHSKEQGKITRFFPMIFG
jgi:hypothetical protein